MRRGEESVSIAFGPPRLLRVSRTLRIAILLLVLAFVAMSLWAERTRIAQWDSPLWVAVYPINGAGTPAVDDYVRGLAAADFEPIERYMQAQAHARDVALERPVEMKLAPQVDAMPPAPPREGNMLQTILWSLHMRYWAWRHDTFDGPHEIRMFVVYHDPARRKRLAHSLGLRKGFLGVVNGFGARRFDGRNNVVITHELLHTLGATDKYDPATGQPVPPAGYADPDRRPLLPQDRAEIMGARIPVTPEKSRMPPSLAATVIGPVTAREIGWR